jgi:hypothetical protein
MLELPRGIWRALDLFGNRHKQNTNDLARLANAAERIARAVERIADAAEERRQGDDGRGPVG